MTTPTAIEILRAAAASLNVRGIETDGATADQWRDIAALVAERTAEWLTTIDRHLAEKSAAGLLAEMIEGQKRATRKRIASMETQKAHAAFLEWGRNAVASGHKPANVNDLQALPGFDPAWSGKSADTLKSWAREAGFRFHGGRPKKNK